MDGTPMTTDLATARARARCLLAAVTAVTLLVSLVASRAVAESGATGMVRGRVVDRATGRPVAGATISLPGDALRARSRPNGTFQLPAPVRTEAPYRRLRAEVTAPGWGRWTIRGVPLYPNDTLILNVELRSASYDHRVLTPDERASSSSRVVVTPTTHTGTCTGWTSQRVPPETISVFISEDGAASTYDFDFYVAHVLPDEWIPSWDADSLAAGAVAVKTFAHYRTMPDHAYSEGKGCADVIDTSEDQVFDPTWSSGATDAATYASFGSILWKDGSVFLSQYWAGAPDDKCAPVEGQYAGRMSQWGTQTCALDGALWPDIVTTFYDDGGDTVWKYLQNLLLNPQMESEPLYPWLTSDDTTIARSQQGGSYSGKWYLSVTSTSTARLYQSRPFVGSPKTAYHFEAALRCGPENIEDCRVTMKVTVIAEDGVTKVKKKKTYTVPNDDVWRLYTYDPAASGIDHVTVQARFITKYDIDLDSALLSAPFGGP
jgi:Carboxypeptidase regulatory-like domain/Stage II sporulation protein